MKAERSPKIPGNESELRGFNPNQPREPNGRFASKGGGTGGVSSKKLTNSSENVRLDSNGVPFNYPTVKLSRKEYKNVMDEIGRTWNTKYEGKEMCRLVFTNKIYYFENRGIGDYNIYKVTKW